MNGFYFHPRRVFEMYISRPVYLAVVEVLLYHARFSGSTENGIRISAGQLLIKKSEIADICGVTLSQVRTALDCFVKDGGITVENCGRKGVLITLLPPFRGDNEKKPGTAYRRSSPPQRSDTYTPDPGASYDLKRAEERARKQVPKLKKGNRH